MNQNVRIMDYAIRGTISERADEIEKELLKGEKKPFNKIIRVNLGDCHAVGQIPITFLRQLLATCTYTELLKSSSIPSDVKERAKIILQSCTGGSVGSYSTSSGIDVIRQHVAKYIEKRDGHRAYTDNIILCAGVAEGFKTILKLFKAGVDCKNPGVMIPVPQFPLYTATLTEYGISRIPYFLKESNFWSLDMDHLKDQIKIARSYCFPRAIVVINPGNPTGQLLTRENIEDLIRFAYKERLFIFADELYQDNVYDSKFFSFKKVMIELGEPYNKMECASFMSASKGYTGECGLRGAYIEVFNMDTEVKEIYKKLLNTSLCSPTLGQVAIDAIVNPPQKGEPSYDLFIQEKTKVLGDLKIKAKMVVDAFNSYDGFKCNPLQGALYAFPKITLPPGALKKAEKKKILPDVYYCKKLLEKTGIVTVPGSGFGQEEGTYHFRTTILPPVEVLQEMLKLFQSFHKQFFERYSKYDI
ncbi:alanine aminotransferase 2-like isoform X2 [Agrilus planipennis]|nr:alanine aminotransferase 2-like isoform X2 [Agrilus planipennis]